MQPTVFERLCRSFRILKITLEHTWPLHQDLSIRSDLHFQPGQRFPDFSNLKLAFTTDRGDTGAFCLAISFNQRKSNGIEELQHLWGDRRCARVSNPDTIEPQTFLQLPENSDISR